MQDEEALQGWMFINHLALHIYQLIYSRLLENDMLAKHSVSDIIMLLSDIRKARINGDWLTCEITKKVAKTLGNSACILRNFSRVRGQMPSNHIMVAAIRK